MSCRSVVARVRSVLCVSPQQKLRKYKSVGVVGSAFGRHGTSCQRKKSAPITWNCRSLCYPDKFGCPEIVDVHKEEVFIRRGQGQKIKAKRQWSESPN